MKLSIIIIALDEEAHLRRCLQAIAAARHPGIESEVVVVDGGSRDATCAIAEGAGARVISTERGIPRQRNAGARAATGEVLAYVDADVEILPGWLDAVATHFQGDELKLLGGPRSLPPSAGPVVRAYALYMNWSGVSSRRPPQINHDPRLLSTGSLVLGRSVFDRVGGFREDLSVSEDTAFIREAVAAGAVVIHDPALAYVHHGEPSTLQEFFQNARWHADYSRWWRALRRGDWGLAAQRRYLYGLAIAGELVGLGLSVASGPLGWPIGVPLFLTCLGATVGAPALQTAWRHRRPERLGALCLMFGAYGLAHAADLVGLRASKRSSWRPRAAR